VANRFLAFELLAGKRVVEVTERRTAVDVTGSRYEAFEPTEAGRLADRIEWHDTPTHGSWRNMAEIERSVLARPCLGRRIPNRDTLAREVAAWETKRNAAGVMADRPFTTADA
jgi:hypothetical protein